DFLAIEQAGVRGAQQVEAVVVPLRPRRDASELTNVRFSHVLGYFETRYDRSDKARERTYNLRLAASKLDGHVLLPGETFDFNDVVGPRDETNGYRTATVIAEGELVDGIGGGTCQISGTLHGAAFFAGLDILERVPHTRPSSYIKMGLDATVVYPTINFRFKNGFDFPVVLHETVKDGVVRAEILGPERKHTVTLIRRITEALPYEQLEREDDRLPRGVRVLSQRGMAGFTVTRYRIVREQQHAIRERWLDKYPPTPQIIRVGTGEMPKDSVEATDDPHPEYLADELLVMTQTSDVSELGEQAPLDNEEAVATGVAKPLNGRTDERSSNTFESRQAGWTGVAGWTKEQKMPQWESEHPTTREKARSEKDSIDRSARPSEPNEAKLKAPTKDAAGKKPGRSKRE
ncbi:MAG: VanW family protein, partial [Myxococcales bacterium]